MLKNAHFVWAFRSLFPLVFAWIELKTETSHITAETSSWLVLYSGPFIRKKPTYCIQPTNHELSSEGRWL